MSFPAKTMDAIEGQCVGFKVVAGPFFIDAPQPDTRRGERQMCRAALAQQTQAGVKAKIVVFRAAAYVLRSAKGWIDHMESQNNDTRTPVARGLFCPRCNTGPLGERSLRLHGCAALPPVRCNRRTRKGRLDNEDITRAKEVANAS